ncbi:hypothetical protein [Streptomyces sp. AK02-01A]|nr:hypothetical protein [Streptomyces sp. AK02-01A]MDX3854133.1 hypothetical protein [Streptomyces sp. AK02-01A]
MVRPKERGRRRRRRPRRDWVQLAALVLPLVTAIAGCVQKLI